MKKLLLHATLVLCSGALALPASAKDPSTKVTIKKGRLTVGDGKNKVDLQSGSLEAAAEGGEGDDTAAATDAVVNAEGVTAAGVVQGDQLLIEGTGKKVTHVCGGDENGAVVINISGNSNTVTLKGECKQVQVAGNSNKVTIEAAGEINASGNNIFVSYKRGLDNKPPKILKAGNKVTVVKEKEK